MVNNTHSKTNNLNEFNNASMDTLNQAKVLLEEKFTLDLKMTERKYQMQDKEMEYEEQERFTIYKDTMNKEINMGIELKEKSNKYLFSNIFEEYKTSLEDEYLVFSKSLVFQHENSLKKEIQMCKDSLENEFIQKEQQFKEATNLLEKLYYNGK